MRKPFYLLLAAAFLTSALRCNREPEPETTEPRPEETVYNYAYGDDPQQQMDVYIPRGIRDTMGVVVLVHGGSWYGGDRSQFAPWFEYERTVKRYVVLNMDYRLDKPDEPPVPMQTDDIALAIETLRNDFDVPAEKIVIVGGSAGGHLATLYAYKYDTGHYIKGVVDFVGPVDFTDPQYHEPGHWEWIFSGIEYIFNHPYEGNEEYYKSVSPYYYVNEQTPPTIMFYGGQDTLVPYTQGERLHQRLDSFQVENEYYLYPNSGHIFNETDGWDAYYKAEAFMVEHLK